MRRKWLWSVGFAAVLFAAAPAAFAAETHILRLDTHMDTPMNFARPGWDIMDAHSFDADLSQVDYPRMVKGELDGGFFAIYTPQGPRTPAGFAAARDAALKRAVEIHEMVARHSDTFALATRADDAARIAASGKRIVYMSMENSYPLGKDLTLLKTFYELGVRMAGPVHFTNNDLADSATDPKGPEWHGLSPLGKEFVAEANRLGIILDASHASDDVFDQMLALSAAPIILSHSGVRAVFNHPRNIDDARIQKLAAAGGVIQINSYSDYLVAKPAAPARDAAMRVLGMKYGPFRTLVGEKLKAYMAERHAVEAQYRLPEGSIDDVMAHLLHALKLVGPDHVGIGLDWDGGGGVAGMEDVAGLPEISKRLLAAGYSEVDIAKIWGGNALRVMRAVEGKAAELSRK
ncbi:MAG TPA: dipeptidase [Micropepsaceae bacterium]|nr:dipeptidase [Micropepsaceae bacterium]